MSTTIFPDTQPVPEASCRVYSTQLVDADGQNLSSGQISSIRFTLHDAASNRVINDRYFQEVMNINGGMLSPTGVFEMEFNEADTVAVGTSKLQKRRALFTVRYDNCTENHEVFFYVQNLYDVPHVPNQPWVLEDVSIGDSVAAALA